MFKMRVYRGWVIVALTITISTCLVGVTTSSFGLFVLPVSQEFGLSRAEMNTALILVNLGFALGSPVIGYMLDRVSIRRMMIISAIIFGLSLVVLGRSNSIWLSAIVLLLPLSFAYMGAGGLTGPALIARWFTASRGRAMALWAIGLSLSSVVVAPLIALSLETYDWRTTLVVAGVSVTTIILLAMPFIRNSPGPNDLETRVAGSPDATITQASRTAPRKASELARSPLLWMIALSVAMTLAVAKTLLISLVPIAQSHGISTLQASSLIAATGSASIFGTLIFASFADRVDRILMLSVLCLVMALVNLALFFSESYSVLLLTSVMLGLTVAAVTPLFFALLADQFGPASFGTAKGLVTPLGMIISVITVRFAGEVYDRTGDYDAFFLTAIASQVLAAGIVFRSRFVKRPVPAIA